MSKTFTNDHPAIFLLDHLLKAAGWEMPNLKKVDDYPGIDRDQTAQYRTKKAIRYKNMVTSLGLEIGLVFSIKDQAFVLYKFLLRETKPESEEVILPNQTKVLAPEVFLKFYGKTVSDLREHVSLWGRPLHNGLWVIEQGKNLVALFDAYDQLAIRLGLMPLFQPMPQGKAS